MTLPRVVEFCSGYGGATAGMIAAGLQIEASYDIWSVAVDAHRRWHPDVACEVRDVATVEPHELEGRIVWASLPCQPWSTANRVRRAKSHSSYYSLARFAHQVQYARFAIIENVPGLLHERDGREELGELERECARLGLPLSINLIPAAWYGVPQLRRRAIIVIGAPLTAFSPFEPVAHPLELQPAPTTEVHGGWQLSRDARLSLAVRATHGGGVDSAEYRGLARSATTNGFRPDSRMYTRLAPAPTASEGKGRRVARDGGWSSQKQQRLEKVALASERRTGRQQSGKWMNLERSPTATEHASGTSTDPATRQVNFVGRTPAENAALQGVPMEHIAHLPITHQYTLIGNAVPPRFAEGVMRQLIANYVEQPLEMAAD